MCLTSHSLVCSCIHSSHTYIHSFLWLLHLQTARQCGEGWRNPQTKAKKPVFRALSRVHQQVWGHFGLPVQIVQAVEECRTLGLLSKLLHPNPGLTSNKGGGRGRLEPAKRAGRAVTRGTQGGHSSQLLLPKIYVYENSQESLSPRVTGPGFFCCCSAWRKEEKRVSSFQASRAAF